MLRRWCVHATACDDVYSCPLLPRHLHGVFARSIEVIVAARRNIYVLDPNEAWEPVLSEQQMVTYTAMSVSPSGRLLALFGETGKIWVLSTNFEENITTFDTQSKVRALQ